MFAQECDISAYGIQINFGESLVGKPVAFQPCSELGERNIFFQIDANMIVFTAANLIVGHATCLIRLPKLPDFYLSYQKT
ncbi:MAG: hypothetical protein BWY63_02914 [Chloroflexi bacterium ADurb.Bin360]|nr:MAG: hypothetical protein BWY63_02914 [Chloroflexi bacterium ADurb.Bin360]